MLTSLVYMIIVLVVVGVLLYILSLIPMDATIKRIIQILTILVVGIWVVLYLLMPVLSHAPWPPGR